MAKFRKKPVVIEAFQPGRHGRSTWPAWAHVDDIIGDFERDCYVIKTLEGDMTARPDDWIIKGVKGELYPCKPDIFAATYEIVEE